jgi:hypothetical protein
MSEKASDVDGFFGWPGHVARLWRRGIHIGFWSQVNEAVSFFI